jgi:hypothetical protein
LEWNGASQEDRQDGIKDQRDAKEAGKVFFQLWRLLAMIDIPGQLTRGFFDRW